MDNKFNELKPMEQMKIDTKTDAEKVEVSAEGKKDYSVIIFFLLIALFISYIVYDSINTKRYLKRIAQERAANQKAYAEEQVRITAEEEAARKVQAEAEEERKRYALEEEGKVPSTDLFLKAVQAEKGDTQQQAQPQILDYGSQVAAYEAQAKAQREAAVRQTAAPQANATSVPSRQTGAAAVANKNPASLIQPEKQQETKLNKLETRRIFK